MAALLQVELGHDPSPPCKQGLWELGLQQKRTNNRRNAHVCLLYEPRHANQIAFENTSPTYRGSRTMVGGGGLAVLFVFLTLLPFLPDLLLFFLEDPLASSPFLPPPRCHTLWYIFQEAATCLFLSSRPGPSLFFSAIFRSPWSPHLCCVHHKTFLFPCRLLVPIQIVMVTSCGQSCHS